MLTPAQLKTVSTIVGEEQERLNAQNPHKELGEYLKLSGVSVSGYITQALAGKGTIIAPIVHINGTGTVDIHPCSDRQAFNRRLVARAGIRIAVRMLAAKIPIGHKTRDWMESAIYASDFRSEVESARQ